MSTVLLQKEYRGSWESDNLPSSLLPREEKRLFQRLEINSGDKKVRDEIVERNTRLVRSWAKKIKNSYPISDLELGDLCQEGSMGLMKAVDKFDWKKGYKFSTYATWWIRLAVTRAVADQARTIRIPVDMIETISKYEKAKRRLLQSLGRDPLPEEIAAEMGIDVSKVRFIEEIKDDTISLERPLRQNNGDGENALIDFIEDKKIDSPSVKAEAEDIREKLKEILSSLEPREKKILMMRFGLGDGKYYILQEVGDVLGITKERVRQIQKNALRKLKRDPRTILLK